MWGIIPAAGKGSRIQPLAFSKELLPVGERTEAGEHRPRAVSDYLVERLVIGGATRLCFVISPGKSDILEYYGGAAYGVPHLLLRAARALGTLRRHFPRGAGDRSTGTGGGGTTGHHLVSRGRPAIAPRR